MVTVTLGVTSSQRQLPPPAGSLDAVAPDAICMLRASVLLLQQRHGKLFGTTALSHTKVAASTAIVTFLAASAVNATTTELAAIEML